MARKKNRTLFWVFAILIVVLASVFAIQNSAATEINFLFVEVTGPLFFVIVIVFILGFLLGRIFHWLPKKRNPEK